MKHLATVATLLAGLFLSGCSGDRATAPTMSPADRPLLGIVAGDGATAPVNSAVNVVVQVTGVAQPNLQVVNFVVVSGGGSVYAPTVKTARPTAGPGAGTNGIASDVWTLGTKSGPQALEARLINPANGAVVLVATLNATATPGPAAQLTVVGGDQQIAEVGAAVSVSPTAKVSDQYGNGIVGISVTFAVSQGGGSVTGASQVTGSTGLATAGSWTLGTVAGTNALTVATPTLALTGSPAQVVATGRAAVSSRLVTGQRTFSPRIGTVISPAAQVTDANGNGVPNVVVTFTVRTGGGSLDGVGSVSALTDGSGNARVDWAVGATIVSNTLQATAQGLQGSPITFVAIPYDCDCWSTKASMPTPRRDVGIGLMNGLIHTAVGSPGPYSAVLEVYDPATDQWTTRAPVAAPYAFPASGVMNGLLYLASGFGPSGLLDRVQAYDPVLNQWTPKAPIPTRRIQAASAVTGGLMYVMGGDNSGNGTASANVEAYDPAQDQWATKAPLPTARFEANAGVFGGRIYVVGGRVGNPIQQLLARVDVYDPATNSWTPVSPMPTARLGATVAVANGLLYVIGGLDPAKLATVEVYDPATDVWVTRTSMPTPRGNAVSAFTNGRIFVLSGRDATGVEVFATNEAYQP